MTHGPHASRKRVCVTAFDVSRSSHKGDGELASLLYPRGPADGNGLCPLIEFEGVRTVLVEITEDGFLPAPEGVIGQRYRDRHVGSHHVDVDAIGQTHVPYRHPHKDCGALCPIRDP